ncbi:MAG TPA: hypothetical protein VK163_16970 [Opitutaceae bacterium]|nr:hypothetical protein [Opitutaceae bacterium]
MASLEQQRLEFIRRSAGFRAFPLAGLVTWAAVGIASWFVTPSTSLYVMLFATGAIFPLALGIAALTGQQIFQKGNAFATLMGQSVLMVNLLWALHFALILQKPALAPLSLAIGLGLHWIVFGWIIQMPLGLIHAIARTAACTAAYAFGGEHRLAAISAAVVVCYALTLVQLSSWNRCAVLRPTTAAGID